MKPERQNLIHDLLDEHHGARREAALFAGGRVLRRKRWGRRACQTFAVLTVLGVAAIAFQKLNGPVPPSISSIPAPAKPAGSLSDEELLALFPNTPVGLATMADGKKRLVFPRPGDEARFVTRL